MAQVAKYYVAAQDPDAALMMPGYDPQYERELFFLVMACRRVSVRLLFLTLLFLSIRRSAVSPLGAATTLKRSKSDPELIGLVRTRRGR